MSMGESSNGWRQVRLGDVAEVQTGISKSQRAVSDPVTRPYLRVANVQDGRLDLREIKTISVERKELKRFELQPGDVLMTEGGDFDKLGRGTVWRGELKGCLHQNHVFAVRPNSDELLPDFLAAWTASASGRRFFAACSKQTTNLASINSSQVKAALLGIPSLEEQNRIVRFLETTQRAPNAAERLLNTKRRFKRGLTQQLLTGKRRFPQFVRTHSTRNTPFGTMPQDWDYVRLADVATEISERAGANNDVAVLACSKYDGLVSSLTYFGRRIYSSNTSNYKVVMRGDFAFPSNHIEEGSIGLLRDIERGLVSPIYTVFRPTDRIVPEFLFALFKTETYRHVFATATNASVDRRGSLRWNEFSKLRVPVPTVAEQRRIAELLGAADAEIRVLSQYSDALERQKRALLNKLFSGELRLPKK